MHSQGSTHRSTESEDRDIFSNKCTNVPGFQVSARVTMNQCGCPSCCWGLGLHGLKNWVGVGEFCLTPVWSATPGVLSSTGCPNGDKLEHIHRKEPGMAKRRMHCHKERESLYEICGLEKRFLETLEFLLFLRGIQLVLFAPKPQRWEIGR